MAPEHRPDPLPATTGREAGDAPAATPVSEAGDATSGHGPTATLGLLAPFAGTWHGEGRGTYPTIEDFGYREEIVLRDVGRPFLVYSQRTSALDDGRPLHAETGYWRPKPGGRIELVIAQATGMVEIEEGTIEDGVIAVASTAVAATSSGPDASRVTRRFELAADGAELRYELRMEAVGQPLLVHLVATLRRAEDRS